MHNARHHIVEIDMKEHRIMPKIKLICITAFSLLICACSPNKYQYLRLDIEGGFNPEEVQLSEIVFLNGETPLSVEIVSFTSEYHNKKWSHEKIIDGDEATSWANGNEFDRKYPHQFEFKLATEAVVDGVKLHTGTQSGNKYRLSRFSLHGSSDQETWSPILSGTLEKDKENNWETFQAEE